VFRTFDDDQRLLLFGLHARRYKRPSNDSTDGFVVCSNNGKACLGILVGWYTASP
jgi:hypothetical protein